MTIKIDLIKKEISKIDFSIYTLEELDFIFANIELHKFKFSELDVSKMKLPGLDNNWVVGFIDGEGCFHVSIQTAPKLTGGFRFFPEFNVTQHKRDILLLLAFKKFFKCGNIKRNKGDIYSYLVKSYFDINTKILPFFKEHKLKTKKRIDFEKLHFIVSQMIEKNHLNPDTAILLRDFIAKWRIAKINHNYSEFKV